MSEKIKLSKILFTHTRKKISVWEFAKFQIRINTATNSKHHIHWITHEIMLKFKWYADIFWSKLKIHRHPSLYGWFLIHLYLSPLGHIILVSKHKILCRKKIERTLVNCLKGLFFPAWIHIYILWIVISVSKIPEQIRW